MSKNTLRFTKLNTWDPRPGGGTWDANGGALEKLKLWGQNYFIYLSPGGELEEILDRPFLGVHILSMQEPMIWG